MARALAAAGVDAVYSYAGRVPDLARQPLPVRVGGFGGAEGLAAWLREQRISHVIDATHPFAAGMSRNAVAACAALNLPLVALERPAWQVEPGWIEVPDFASAASALPAAPVSVFLAIGKQNLAAFAGLPHRWLLRFAAPDPQAAGILPGAGIVVARGPFTPEGDIALMRAHGTRIVVAKNAGGAAARAKLEAALALDLPVILIARPRLPARAIRTTPQAVLDWLGGV